MRMEPTKESDLRSEFVKRKADYLRLKLAIQESLKILLSEKDIDHLPIEGRVKDVDSFIEKVSRKGYSAPFRDTEDLVGIRVIVFYPDDVLKTVNQIERNFDVCTNEDAFDRLEVDQFGYRSHHLIIRMKKSWCITPGYRNLNFLKAEIQVRTVLMHAWAAIAHKLSYKKKQQAPREFHRKLSLLSAKFEEADGQFLELRDAIQEYTDRIAEEMRLAGKFDIDLELNLDTYKEFLHFFYPRNEPHELMAREQFEFLKGKGIDFRDLVEIAMKFQSFERQLSERVSRLTRAATFSYALTVVRPELGSETNPSESRLALIVSLRSAFSGSEMEE